MSAPTKAHLNLALQIKEALALRGNVAAAKLIADSEAEAVLKQTAYLKAMVQDGTNAMKERDQLRDEVKRMTHAYEYDHKCLCEVQDRCHLWNQRAEKAEAELAKYLSACPASPTEEERKRCQQWWSISGRAS